MESIDLSNKYLVSEIGTSTSPVGVKTKYYKDGVWYKKDPNFKESLITELLNCSDYPDYVRYDKVEVNGLHFCKSKTCWSNEITINKIFKVVYGMSAIDVLYRLSTPRERERKLIKTIYKFAGIDITEYIRVLLYLDMLIGNYDRHFNNIGLMYNKLNNKYKPLPIYDNGDCLLFDRMEDCANFGGKHEYVISDICDKIESPIKFDYRRVPTSNSILVDQLNKYEDIFKAESDVNIVRTVRSAKLLLN